MATRTLSVFDLRNLWPSAWGASGTLVITLAQSVVSEDGVEYPKTAKAGGTLRSLGFHWESTITVASSLATCGSISGLINTDTALPAHTATYNIYVYDSKGKMREKLNSKPFHLHENLNGGASTFTWEQWVTANEFTQFRGSTTFIGDYNTVQSMINASQQAHASNLVEGVTYLTAAPTVASIPKAVGENDSRVRNVVTPYQYGAFADQTAHLITLADIAAHPEWIGTYVAGTSWDTVAIQEAIYACFAGASTPGNIVWNGSSEVYPGLFRNKVLHIPKGAYLVNKQINIKGVSGFHIYGDSKRATMIYQAAQNLPIFYFDGLSYGVMEGIGFQQSGITNTEALVEVDYTNTLSPASLKPQQITIADCGFYGNNLGAVGLRFAKSGSAAQCDTILVLNLTVNSFTTAGVMIGSPAFYAFNGLSIQFINGNIQSCPQYGIANYGGSCYVDGMSFQNNTDGNNVGQQTGCDVYSVGGQAPSHVRNVNSESTKFSSGALILDNIFVHPGALQAWYDTNGASGVAAQAVALNLGVTGSTVGGDGKVYKVTTAGTLGGLSYTAVSSATSDTVTVAGANWGVNAFAGMKLTVLDGLGGPPSLFGGYLDGSRGQSIVILSNTADTITLAANFTTTPDNTSHFVVEPNWAAGSPITSGTAVLTLYDYFVVENATVIANSKLVGGKVTLNATEPGIIDNVFISRADAFGNLYDGQVFNRISNVYLLGSARNGQGPVVLKKYLVPSTNGNLGSSQLQDFSQFQIGQQKFVSSGAAVTDANSRYMDLIFGRADGVRGDSAAGVLNTRNAWWVQGTLSGRFGNHAGTTTNGAGGDLYLQGGPSTGNAAPGSIHLMVGTPGASGTALNNSADAAKIDANVAAGETRLLLYDITAGTLQRVSIGAADSGGVGFRALRIPN